MKQLAFVILFILVFTGLFAQEGDIQHDPQLKVREDSLAVIAKQIIEGETEYDRAKACFEFIPKLVKALKIPGSFHYPFEKLQTISILKPEDNSFRIFSWVLQKNNKTFRFYGAIQMNTEDNALQLYPLYDYSDSIQNPMDTVLNNESWYGALYYKILEVKHRKNTYYTLLGWDGNDAMSTKKVADVLYFEDEKPVFGAPVFEIMEEDAEETTIKNRIIVEYKVNSNVSFNYYPPEDMIIHDHVIAPDDKSKGLQFTYVPDGTYVGYKWKKGQWNYVERVFNKNIDKPDDPPVPHPSKEKGLSAPDK
ncbi:MAG: hypothetical protein WD334_03050 [Chitinophagales bacterium]